MRNSGNNTFGDILVGFLAILLAVPLFFIAHRQVPHLDLPYHLDRIGLFLVIVLLLILILRLFKTLITIAFIALIGWLAYGSFTGRYGFESLYNDARAYFYSFQNDANKEIMAGTGKDSLPDQQQLPHQQQLLDAMDYTNPTVRNFAVAATNEFFRDEQQVNFDSRKQIQCFAVFKKINSRWNYVDDPQNSEYFAKASESAKLLAGDCDDHAVLMAAAIKVIGGRPRLVHTTAHIYPELFIGSKNDLERINYLIKEKLFPAESKGHDLHYHEDKDGIWLNLDYTQHYPGGDFMAEPVLGVLYP
jgi:hypothetical protein